MDLSMVERKLSVDIKKTTKEIMLILRSPKTFSHQFAIRNIPIAFE